MESFTIIESGKKLSKFLKIPKEFKDKNLSVTIEPVDKKKEKQLEELDEMFKEARKIKINKKVNVENLTDEALNISIKPDNKKEEQNLKELRKVFKLADKNIREEKEDINKISNEVYKLRKI